MNKIFYSVIVALLLLTPGSALAQGQGDSSALVFNELVNSVWIPIFGDSTCFMTGQGDPEECAKADGISYYNSETGELLKPLPYRNGIPLCHDLLFVAGALGNMCYDEGDYPTDDDYEPITDNDNDNDKCSNRIGSAGMEFPYEKKTECQKQEWDQCIEDRENGVKWDDRCKDLNEGFFDDCEGYANKEECDEAWYTPLVDDSRKLVQPGCEKPNSKGQCYVGMPEDGEEESENATDNENSTDEFFENRSFFN
jgi:hypothetical protein